MWKRLKRMSTNYNDIVSFFPPVLYFRCMIFKINVNILDAFCHTFDTFPQNSAEHFIRNAMLILGRASLYSPNSLSPSWSEFHKSLLTFWSMFTWCITYSVQISPLNIRAFLPHPKGVLPDSDLVTWEGRGSSLSSLPFLWNLFWDICFVIQCVIMVEGANRRW